MSNKLVKNTFIVLVIIFAGKLIAFLRDILITYYFGSNQFTDSYFIANNVPSILYTAIISSIVVLFIPLYKEEQVTNGKISANLFASRLLNDVVIFSIVLTAIGLLIRRPLINIIAPGFSVEQKIMASQMCSILLLSFPFNAASLILANISNANNKYYSIQVIPIISSVIILIALFIFHDYGIYSLIYSAVIAFVIQLVIQIFIAKSDFKYTINAGYFDGQIKQVCVMLLPVFVGYTMDQINLIINSSLCTYLGVGNVSNYSYALRFQNTFISTISLAIITVIYPILSELFYKQNSGEYREMLTTGTRVIIYVCVPLTFFLSVNAHSLIKMIFGRGNFEEKDVIITAAVFSVLIVSLVFLSIRDLLIRAFYIQKDTVAPLISSIIFGVVNLVLGFIFIKIISIKGLAISYVVASFLSIAYLLLKLKWPKTKEKILSWDMGFLCNNVILALIPILIFYMVRFVHIKMMLVNVLVQFFFVILVSIFFLYVRKEKYTMAFFNIIKSKIHVNF